MGKKFTVPLYEEIGVEVSKDVVVDAPGSDPQ